MGALTVKKKLFVSLGALKGGFRDPMGNQSLALGILYNPLHHLLVLRRIAHDPSFAHLPLSHLKLRFNQGQKPSPLPQKGEERGYDQLERDEGGIDDSQIHLFPYLLPLEVADVASVQIDYAGILLKPPGQLAVSHIDGIDPPGAPLKQTIGEPASRCSYIHDHLPCWIDAEKVECLLQLEPAAADIWLGVTGEADGCLRADQGPRLCLGLPIDQDGAC
jgi:hypothetical protein